MGDVVEGDGVGGSRAFSVPEAGVKAAGVQGVGAAVPQEDEFTVRRQ
jgi:hypothetical protein